MRLNHAVWDKRRIARIELKRRLPAISHVGVADCEGLPFKRIQQLAKLSSRELRLLLIDMIVDGTVVALPGRGSVRYYRRKEKQ